MIEHLNDIKKMKYENSVVLVQIIYGDYAETKGMKEDNTFY